MPFTAHEAPDVIVDLGENGSASLFIWKRDEPPMDGPHLEQVSLYNATETRPKAYATLTAYEGPQKHSATCWHASFDAPMTWHTPESLLAVLTAEDLLPTPGERSLNKAMRNVEKAMKALIHNRHVPHPTEKTRHRAENHVIQGMHAALDQRDASRTLAVWNQARETTP